MLTEHDQGRAFVRGIREATKRHGGGDKDAAADIVRNARGCVDLLHHHIMKEDSVLFRMAADLLNLDDQGHLQHGFHQVQEEEIGKDLHGRYLQIASGRQQDTAKL